MQRTTSLRQFVVNPQFMRFLGSRWKNGTYMEQDSSGADVPASAGILHYLLTYHLYLELLGDRSCDHLGRALSLAPVVIDYVRQDGLLAEPDGSVNDHPAHACHIADALGTFAYYGERAGWDGELVARARGALLRIVERHPVVRLPGGVVGRTQQMRFELRAWYWAWRVTGQEHYREACLQLWENGINAYQHPVADHGQLLQPSLHPDFTWNYACGAGTTTEYATNTHTPAYYCTEPQGFAFVYHHGLKSGAWPRNEHWEDFCRRYFLGLLRNLSRAGHTMPDLDGYGIHRSWYGGCLIETSPLEAAALGDLVGLPADLRSWFRWYAGRYADFIQRCPEFEKTGLPGHMPYGHNLTIEKQFPALICARFYAHIARSLLEYGLDEIVAQEPPAFASYAWWHNWLRVSTPAYETSFVGTTSLRDIPRVRHFGDPNLGCIHGGAALSTLFGADSLLYATANNTEALWHVELTDYNGQTLRSSSTSFADATSMTVRLPDGRLLGHDSFVSRTDPLNVEVDDRGIEVLWSKQTAKKDFRFFVHNRYRPESFTLQLGGTFPAGLYASRAVFHLAIPQGMEPEALVGGNWQSLGDGWQAQGWPQALRWRDEHGNGMEVALSPECATAAKHASARAIVPESSKPGGENSFCPFPLIQLSLEATITDLTDRVCLLLDVTPIKGA